MLQNDILCEKGAHFMKSLKTKISITLDGDLLDILK